VKAVSGCPSSSILYYKPADSQNRTKIFSGLFVHLRRELPILMATGGPSLTKTSISNCPSVRVLRRQARSGCNSLCHAGVKAEGRMMNEEAESKAALGQKQKMESRKQK
jgi:hypothetical protein